MVLFGVEVPQWALDWSGSTLVAVSLWYLFTKREGYWHFSNASLLPYFLLFATTAQYMLAGLQVCYLLFGIHGIVLWRLERRRDRGGSGFNEGTWYLAPWALSLCIFAYTVWLTNFVDQWAWFQFAIVSASLLANVGTTRKWLWSWFVWIPVNCAQAVYFWHYGLMGQFLLQFLLIAMSAYGAYAWWREGHPAGKGSLLAQAV